MESIAVVAMPFPVQGHLNGMLHMSLLLASRGLPVHFAAPTQQVRQARARAGGLGWDPRTLRSIEFHGFEVPAYASPPPDPAAPSPFPSHLVPMCEAFVAGARAPVAALLSRVSARHHCRAVVLHDRLSSFAALEAARIPNGEAFCMTCVAASYDSSWTDAGRRLLRERGLEAPPVEVCTARELIYHIIRTQGDSQSPAFPGVVMNTSRAIEDEFVDVAAQDPEYRGKKIFAVARRAAKPSAARRDDVTNRGWTAATTLQPGLARQAATGVGAVRIVRHDVDAAGRAARGARRRAVRQQAAVPLGPARRRSRRSTRGGSRRREPAREADLRAQRTDGRYRAGGHRVGAAAGDPGGRRHGRVHEPLRLELHHGEPEPRAADARLAHALGPAAGRGARVQVPQGRDPGEALAQARCGELVTPSDVVREAIEKAMASEEGLAMLERAKALRESIVHASTAEGGSSRKDLDDFFAYITR